MAKGLRKPIAKPTHTRADKTLQRVFVDLNGKMAVPSIGGNWHTLIVRGNCTRFKRVYFLGKKSDAASAFESFLAEVQADGTQSAAMAVRSVNGGEFFRGNFGKLCRKRGIKLEFTPADSPKYNGVAEQALALINDTALAARIQVPVLYPDAPASPSVWAEAASWACHVLNRTATTANIGDKAPYGMWYGLPPPPGEAWPFLKPAICRVKRDNKGQPKAQDCYNVGPSVDHPCSCMPVLTAHRAILTPRNVICNTYPLLPRPRSNCPLLLKRGIYSGEGREWGGRVKSRRKEGGRLVQ